MKRFTRLLVMAVLLFQLIEVAAPNSPALAQPPATNPPARLAIPGQNVACRTIGTVRICASVSNATPARYTNVTVYGTLTVNGVPQVGKSMRAIWKFKTTTSTCFGLTNTSGLARCTRNISSATRGYRVYVNVNIGGYSTNTWFTPR